MRKFVIAILIVAQVVASCQNFSVVPIVSIKFDNPIIKVDSCGNMEISDSGKVWYPVMYRADRRARFDTLQTSEGEILLSPKYGLKTKRYEVMLTRDWIRTVSEPGFVLDSTFFYDNYNATYYILLTYPPFKWLNIKDPITYTVRNYRDMQIFHNELPDTIISEMETEYLDDTLFIIETKYPDEYVIIPDCHWNMADVINYSSIRLYDDSLELEYSRHKYENKLVFYSTNKSPDDWQTVFVRNEYNPTIYTGYLTNKKPQ